MSSTRSFARRTFRKKVLAAVYDINGGLKSKRILRATSEKPSSDKLINALLVASQIAGMRCRVDGRMRLVIILASAGLGKSTAILKTGRLRKIQETANADLTWKQRHPKQGLRFAWRSMTRNRIVDRIGPSLFLDKKGIHVGRDARQPFNHSY
jgi:hypothetical protein